jgi:hypothetical protein
MNHLAAASLGLVAGAATLLGSYLNRPEQPRHEAPAAVTIAAKADRQPLPETEEPLLSEIWPPLFVSIPRPPPPTPPPPPPPPTRVATAEPLKLQPHADPVCGPRGRVWYTKDNGWRYWRCVR